MFLNLIVQNTLPTLQFQAPAADTYTFNGQFTRTDMSPNPVSVQAVQNGASTKFLNLNFNDPSNPAAFGFCHRDGGWRRDGIYRVTTHIDQISGTFSGLPGDGAGRLHFQASATLQGTTTASSGANGIAIFTNLTILQTDAKELKAVEPSSTTVVSPAF